MRRLAVAVALAIAAAAVPVAAGASPRAGSPPTYAVRKIGVTFVDRSRKTPANSSAHVAGSKTRVLVTTIWIPEGPGPFPLIVFAHGNGSNPNQYEPTVEPWAEAGYVVAAPTFPISSRDGGSNGGVADVANQPGDMRFVITRVLALSRAKGALHGKVDPAHIGIAGHSLGAVTTLGFAERSCCRDKRVDAAISISGTPLIGGTDFKGTGPALLLIHGDHDPTVNYAGSSSSYVRASPPKYFLTVLGGLHGDFLGGYRTPAVPVVAQTMLDFWNAYLKNDAAALARLPTDSAPGITTMQATPSNAGPAHTTAFVRGSKGPREVSSDAALPSGPRVEVFMKVRATPTQIAAVRRLVRRTTTATAFRYLDKQAALKEFQQIFRTDPDIVDKTTADQLPVSFRVAFRKSGDRNQFRRAVARLPGVDQAIVAHTDPQTLREITCEPGFADLEVFLDASATDSQRASVADALRGIPQIMSIRAIDKPGALRIFRCLFANKPKRLSAVTADILPASFRITVAPGADYRALEAQIRAIPHVDLVRPGEPPGVTAPTEPAS